MTILSCKTIFGLTFSAILENLLEAFFLQSPKNCDFGHFLARLAKISQNENFYKFRAVLFFTLIVPQLHAEFQKNRWSRFRDQFITSKHTSEHTSKHTSGQG